MGEVLTALSDLLDPRAPWVWLLYALTGAAVVTVVLPRLINELDPADRDAFRAHPPMQAFIWLVIWALWPLLVAGIVVEFVVVETRIALGRIRERIGGGK